MLKKKEHHTKNNISIIYMASEYKKASAYPKAVDKSKIKKKKSSPAGQVGSSHMNAPKRPRNVRVREKIYKEKGTRIAKRLIKKAVAAAPKGKGKVPPKVREAGVRVRAQITGKKVGIVSKTREFNDGQNKVFRAEPARILRRQNQDELFEMDKQGLSFPSLHDEFKKTMSLLAGEDVGDSL